MMNKNLIRTALLSMFLAATCFAQQATVQDSYAPSIVDVAFRGKVLIITEDKCNDTELFYPLYRLVEAGYSVTIATLHGGRIAGYNSASIGTTVAISTIDPSEYKALYLPGGKAPAKLREYEQVLSVVKHFVEADKPVAAICHGPQLLVSAGALSSKKATAYPTLEEELVAAGASFINQPVVVSGNIITARMPGDLPPHVYEFLKMLEKIN